MRNKEDINMRNKEGDTLLIVQCKKNCLVTAKFLLDSGADANLTDKEGSTVFAIACRLAHYEIIKLLLEYGVGINQASFRLDETLADVTPLVEACFSGRVGVARLLFDWGTTLDKVDLSLRIACIKDEVEIVRLLLEQGASVDNIDGQYTTPLMLAVGKRARPQINSLLVQYGADIDAIDHKGESALVHATKLADVDMVRHLLLQGADIYSADGVTDTISHLPLVQSNSELSALVEQYKSINIRANRALISVLK